MVPWLDGGGTGGVPEPPGVLEIAVDHFVFRGSGVGSPVHEQDGCLEPLRQGAELLEHVLCGVHGLHLQQAVSAEAVRGPAPRQDVVGQRVVTSGVRQRMPRAPGHNRPSGCGGRPGLPGSPPVGSVPGDGAHRLLGEVVHGAGIVGSPLRGTYGQAGGPPVTPQAWNRRWYCSSVRRPPAPPAGGLVRMLSTPGIRGEGSRRGCGGGGGAPRRVSCKTGCS
jgi:hypothetical protein